MSAKILHTLFATATLAGACATVGCVADRPSRNGVFNENQYVKKSFLVRPGDNSKPDNGWFMKATIVQTSTPNPLSGFGMFQGAESASFNPTGSFVRFDVTQDRLQLLSMREISANTATSAALNQRTPEVVNAWPITNVDLKYRVNLDGEKTNYYEENQELDWQVRQWVKVNFSRNDLTDLAPFGSWINTSLGKCAGGDATATLVPGTFNVDEANDYMSWVTSITVPINYDDATCMQGYGQAGTLAQKMGRQNVTMNVMFSFTRATPAEKLTYQPLIVEEKDPIQRKYGTFKMLPIARDTDTGLVGSRAMVMRFDPAKDIKYYFVEGFPEDYKTFFTGKGGIADQTNAVLAKAGGKGKLVFLNYNDKDTYGDKAGPARQYGDVRYSFINWHADLDLAPSDGTVGLAQFFSDPRTGENLAASVNFWEMAVKDSVLARFDFYLQTVGAEAVDGSWPDLGACKDGDTAPFVAATVHGTHNGNSTVYAKMQTYMQKPVASYGKLGPADFIPRQDADFFRGFYGILPYQLYSDPEENPFVTPEGGTGTYSAAQMFETLSQVAQFNKLAGQLEKGWVPYDANDATNGLKNATSFLDNYRSLSRSVRNWEVSKHRNYGMAQADNFTEVSYLDIFQKNARHCINGKWETRDEYVSNLIHSVYQEIILHELGHTLGLRHNFMGSVDRSNFPHYTDGSGRDQVGLYSSTVMEYNATASSAFFRSSNGQPGWGPYDMAAIGWIYANQAKSGDSANTLSGQASATAPWKDPMGFGSDGKEVQYLFCTDEHVKYSPFCRQYDLGTTPSEIIAAELDNYEWQYKWSNFRLYRKYWSEAAYAQRVANFFYDLRRFQSAWTYDWSAAEITDTLRRIGITPPANAPAGTYYQQLTNKFNLDISTANQMVAAFHEAIIQQTSGERPYKTLSDNFYGDVTQQGILVDKLQSLTNWTALWESDNYDPVQAQGAYIASFSGAFGDSSYQTISEGAVDSMVGGSYDAFAYFKPFGVAQFAEATHDVNFAGRVDVRDWVGGQVFYREGDFLDFFRAQAVKWQKYGCNTTTAACTWDPRQPRDKADFEHSDSFNRFVGPDGRRWIWVYVMDRNAWVAVDQDRNTASFVVLLNYTTAVINGEADGSGANGFDPYGLLLPVKYFIDSFTMYNGLTSQ